jgi:tetratricopeptide (TPR) repeat protein
MSRFLATRLAIAGVLLAFGTATLAAENTVRPEVGKPLKAAEALLKAGKGHEALAKVNEADAVANKTPYESLLIEQMRGSAAHAAGDYPTAIKAFQSAISSGKLGARESLAMVEAIAVDYYKLKDYPNAAKWSQRYFKDGGTAPAIRTVELQSYYLGNDCASVNKMLAGDESRKPAEDELEILRSCYRKENDQAGYVATTEKLILYYPKKAYWNEMLARVQRKPGFSDRLAIHVYRLRLAVGDLASVNDYMEYAQLALQDGVPGEAKMVMDKGYSSGVLGKGAEAPRQARLRALVDKSLADARKNQEQAQKDAEAASSGDDLVWIGLDYVYDGRPDSGIALIEKGIKKGGLKHPDEAKLRLGEAELVAGHKIRAAQTLKGVHGNDGSADLARLWVLEARA